ncbi:hypothetical protein ZOSMA_40G00470 [Zostera marina]|uniref:Uncharacterized protein n=1 Tax=Zostera marina TaxID=29655 RepID=A0A0K9P356_ZOSMR|nr:hypothetical protein ZOSMA_40G00470 [Zostera marina]
MEMDLEKIDMNWLVLRRFGTQPPWQCFFLGMMITLILYSFSSIFLNWLTQNPNLLILICRSVLAPKSMDGNTNPSSNSVLPLSVLHVVETLHPMGFSKENEEFTNFRDMSLDVLSDSTDEEEEKHLETQSVRPL